MNRKSTGFIGQRVVILPKTITDKCLELPLIGGLFIVRMGVYPKAKNHYYNRPKGITHTLLLYCSDGTGHIQMPAGKIKLNRGEAFLIPAGTPHIYASDHHSPWTIYWFHLQGSRSLEAVLAIMQQTEVPVKPVSVGLSEERIHIFNNIYKALLKGYNTSNLMYANLTFCQFLATLTSPSYFSPSESGMMVESHTERAINFMQKQVHLPVTLVQIASEVNLSVAFFCRCFKKETGYTPIEYFNHLKIQRACQFLDLTELRVSEISLQVGINDSLYFSRLFRKVMGTSPKIYRELEKEHLSVATKNSDQVFPIP